MSDLDAALDTAHRLRAALAGEIEGARGERRLLRTLDASGLFARATHRAAFLVETARLERMLAVSLHDLARRAGVSGTPLEPLRDGPPGPAAALAGVLSEIRALAAALGEIDRLNTALARRALAVVGGYVDALQPVPATYDRSGARAGAPALARVRSKG